MNKFFCKLFGHKYQYINHYYRCARCGQLRWKVEKKVEVITMYDPCKCPNSYEDK